MDKHAPRSAASATVTLSITGMTCQGCAATAKRVLSRVPGATGAEVDLASGRAIVGGSARPEELVVAIEAAGYGARLLPGDAGTGGQDDRG